MKNGNHENDVFYAAVVKITQTRLPTRRVSNINDHRHCRSRRDQRMTKIHSSTLDCMALPASKAVNESRLRRLMSLNPVYTIQLVVKPVVQPD